MSSSIEEEDKKLQEMHETLKEKRAEFQELKQKRKFLSDAIKNAADRIRSEFESHVNNSDPEVRVFIECYNEIMQNVVEEFALSMDQDHGSIDVNRMKRAIDSCNMKIQKEKAAREDNQSEKIHGLESMIREQNAKIEKLKQKNP